MISVRSSSSNSCGATVCIVMTPSSRSDGETIGIVRYDWSRSSFSSGTDLNRGSAVRVLADDAGLARQGRPTREALAHRHREAADPLLVALDARSDHQPLPVLVPQVDERSDAPGELGAELHHVGEQLVQTQCGRERGHHVEHGPHVGPVALQDVAERPCRFAGLCASCPSLGSRRDRLNHRQRSSWLRRRQDSMARATPLDYARCTPVRGRGGTAGGRPSAG